jgi:cytochrome c oxidase subunit 1
MYPEFFGRLSALLVFAGFMLTFFPQYVLGYLSMPRRYHAYPPEFQIYHVLSTAGASILAVGYLLPLFYLLWSLRWGQLPAANPWDAAGLEWTVPSPPPKHDFHEIPVVTTEAYAYPPPERGP